MSIIGPLQSSYLYLVDNGVDDDADDDDDDTDDVSVFVVFDTTQHLSLSNSLLAFMSNMGLLQTGEYVVVTLAALYNFEPVISKIHYLPYIIDQGKQV